MLGVLLEREKELAQLRELIEGARSGEGALALVEGAPGIGKTRLLEEACPLRETRASRCSRHGGWRSSRSLRSASCASCSRGHSGGIPSRTARAAERRRLARQHAVGLRRAPQRPAADATFASLHGLYWLTFNVAPRRPLMIAIDDARWADAASLRFVTYLAAQLEGLPALALLAVAANRGARGGRAAGGAIRGG